MDLAGEVTRRNRKWGRRARNYFISGWVACVVTIAFGVFGAIEWGWGLLLNILVAASGALSAGGALVVESFFLVRKGLLVVPENENPGSIRLEPKCVVLADGPDELRIPFNAIRGATFVFHDSFDGIRGIDDALRIHLTDCSDLIVASGTYGVSEILAWFDRGGRLARVGIGGDES